MYSIVTSSIARRPRAEELAHDDLEVGHGRRQEQLHRAGPLLLRVGAHRDHRHDEQDDHGRVQEDASNHLLIEVHRSAAHHHLAAALDEVVQVHVEEPSE
jgi:hypothetical protein